MEINWIPSWAWWVIGLLILREVFAVVFGWGRDEDGNTVNTRDPEGGTFGKMFNWLKREVRGTYIGWRPIGGEHLTEDPGNSRIKANGEFDTPSGGKEYYHVIRKGKK